tara:strand:+ start:783 stop:1733 length:951 start_codon:yes stop_codon:yes gene_type:complete
MFNQILIVLIYLNIKKALSQNVALASVIFIFLNPYFIISSRNISFVYSYELFTLIFIFLLINRNLSKKYTFLYGFISLISFSIYFPFLIFTTVINVVLLIKDRYKNLKSFFSGYLLGLIANIFMFLPVLNEIKLENISNSKSWGFTSFWRILLQFLSGNSIKNKINSDIDINTFNNQFPISNILYEINMSLIIFLLFLSIFKIIKKIGNKNLDDFDWIFFSASIIAGLLFTIINRPLYPHYYFLFGIFAYIFLLKHIKNTKLIFLVCFIYSLSSILITMNFHNFIAFNDGAVNSDYGKNYDICGKIVEDAKECRGQ